MKNLISILSVLLFFTNCNNSNENKQADSIIGSWKLVETFSHPPSGQGWSQVNNGYTIEITPEGQFSSSQFLNCNTGNTTITSNELILKYDCIGFTANFETPAGVFKYNYEFINGKLVLTPKNFNCYEGCKYKLIKI